MDNLVTIGKNYLIFLLNGFICCNYGKSDCCVSDKIIGESFENSHQKTYIKPLIIRYFFEKESLNELRNSDWCSFDHFRLGIGFREL